MVCLQSIINLYNKKRITLSKIKLNKWIEAKKFKKNILSETRKLNNKDKHSQ